MGRQSLFGRIYESFTLSSTSVVLTENRNNRTNKAVQGLFTDRLTADGCCWKSIGVQIDQFAWDAGSVAQAPVVVTFPYPPPPLYLDARFHTGSAFFSSVDLVSAGQAGIGIARLQVRRQGPRCVGLCIYLNNGRVAILGRWIPTAGAADAKSKSGCKSKSKSDSDDTTTITDLGNSDSSYSVITFQFTPDGGYVSDIVLGSNAVGPFDVTFSRQQLKVSTC